MSELKSAYAMSISGRMTLQMHSLNNEGGEGNQITTRTVALVDPDGTVYKVNAISGDMFKHIQAEHLYLRAKGNLPLCAGCQVFSASRAMDDDRFKSAKNLPKTDAETIDLLLKVCAIDDMEGNLIVPRGAARSIPRKSVAEFGWVVGLPDKTRTESYFHVRYAAERGGDEGVEQPIFHRPASSGVYAAVASFELARIGFNDITQTYPLDEDERLARYKVFLESVLYTFVEPNGAMRNTQNPHIVTFEGVVTVSHEVMPAPALSPLSDGYREEIAGVAEALSRGRNGALAVYPFDTMSRFADILQDIIASTRPYRLFA
jgi:CRISPR-associated protein Cst2